jgi:hypothetical protein
MMAVVKRILTKKIIMFWSYYLTYELTYDGCWLFDIDCMNSWIDI